MTRVRLTDSTKTETLRAADAPRRVLRYSGYKTSADADFDLQDRETIEVFCTIAQWAAAQ